jgi:hypothetical protein
MMQIFDERWLQAGYARPLNLRHPVYRILTAPPMGLFAHDTNPTQQVGGFKPLLVAC